MSGKSKLSKVEIYRILANVINQACYDGNHPLKDKFYLVEPEPGKKEVLKNIGDNVVRFVDEQAVIDSLIKHIEDWRPDDQDYALSHRDAVECIKYWKARTEPIGMPIYLGEKNNPHLCFQRLTFNYDDPPIETPVLDELLSRCSNALALAQYIGSLTIECSSRFQYVWIYGSGGEGKGSLGRGLASIFGTGCVTMAVPRSDGQKQFLAHSLQGKRLCIFPECSNFRFPNDPLFKQMTGNDGVWLEQKGKMGFSGQLKCKFIFFSNDRPAVDGTDANIRRMIYSQINKPTKRYPSGIYDAMIAKEMPSFIIKCRALYLEKCPHNEDIQFADEVTQELIAENEEQFEVLTDKWFICEPGEAVAPARLREIQKLEKLDELSYRKWVDYMRARLGIKNKVGKNGSRASFRQWVGIRERTANESIIWDMENKRDDRLRASTPALRLSLLRKDLGNKPVT